MINVNKNSIILFILSFVLCHTALGQDSTGFGMYTKNLTIKPIGLNTFYPTYLADPLGARFEVSSQSILYGDIDMQDDINTEGSYLGKLVGFISCRLSLLKISPTSNPNLGIEFDLGVTTPVYMREGNHDLIGLDGIYYFAIAGKPTDWLALRFSKHHICTHIGDEYTTGEITSVIDFDPNITQLPVRDDFIFSTAIRPLHFLGNPQWDILQIYGEIGFFLPGSDILGTRQNKPNLNANMNYQAGVELEYYFKNAILGGIYSAINVSAYQLNAFSPNISINSGYIFPQERNKRRLRVGLNYYNGRCLSNQFYNRKEEFVALSLAMDV